MYKANGSSVGNGSRDAARRTQLVEAIGDTGLSLEDLWFRYVALGGTRTIDELGLVLERDAIDDALDHDIIGQALNERLRELGRNAVVKYRCEASHPARGSRADCAYAPTISVVIPTRNEAKNLPYVLGRLPAEVDEVVIVDADSTDDTVETALAYRPDAKIVFQDGVGKGNALACGFRAVTGDITVMLDADGSTDPAEIPRFVAALSAGADFAKGTRFARGGGSADITRIRRLGNWVLVKIVNTIWRAAYSDLCYGYNAFWTRCRRAVDVDCNGFEVETFLNIRLAQSGLCVAEVPSFEAPRRYGKSNLRVGVDGLRVLRTIFAEWIRPR